ncbi:MAG TPA: hypothetical protein VK144_03040 [Bacillota bacterium]|nr:hypothetical protein [Bacillota bacterium]
MMKILLRNQWRMIVNTIRSQSGKNLFSYGVLTLVMIILLNWISRGIYAMSDQLTPALFQGIVSYGSLMAIAMVILIGLPQVFKHLYAATDLNLLFTMPIPTRNIFWMKYIQSFIGVPLFVFIFFSIPVIVYGTATGAHIMYYPVVILTVFLVTILGLSIAYLLNLVIVQIVPASRANEFMMAMSFFSGIIIYLMYMLPTLINDEPVSELLLKGLPLFPDWVPATWVGDAIVKSASGSIDFIIPFGMFVLLVLVFAFVATSLVEKGFRTGWIRLSEGGKKKKKKRAQSRVLALSHPVIAISKKEWFSIKRDLREWFVLMPILFIFIFGAIGYFSGGGEIDFQVMREYNKLSWPIFQGILLFIYALSNGNVAASSIGREGKSSWILQAIPVSGMHIALGKFWISWLIPFILLTVVEVVAGLFLGWTFFQFITGILLKVLITSGISAIGLWLGTTGARYNPTNPQQRLKFGTSFLLLIVSYIYLLVSVIPFVWLLLPPIAGPDIIQTGEGMNGIIGTIVTNFGSLLEWKGSHPALGMILGVGIMVLFSGGIFYLFIRASAHQLNKGIKIEMVDHTSGKTFRKKPEGILK